MRETHWVTLGCLCVCITVIIAFGAMFPQQKSQPHGNPRFVLQDFTERECVYDNVKEKFVACWLKKDGP
jgi:hypothetical protein